VTGAAVALVSLVTVLPTGCASKTEATESTVKCKPGNYVFCRCQDREEGTKLCNEDGKSYGKCEPCETIDNPSIPDDPGVTPVEVDAGGEDAPSTVPACGDKVVQDGEDCDDGNTVADDGCDAKCKVAGINPAATRSCPGLDLHVWAKPVVYVGSTVGAPLTAQLTNSCTSTTGGSATHGANGPDRILKVTAHKTGKMIVTASEANYDVLLYATGACAQAPKTIAPLTCANDTNGPGVEAISFAVQAGSTYTVVADGAGISQVQGAFKLTLSIQ
jgi:cysteine-rich repeat protein